MTFGWRQMISFQDTISYLIAQIARGHRRRAAEHLAECSLYPGQEMVLVRLLAEPGLTQGELAERLGIEPPTLTRALNRLERAGLVERRPDDVDGRLVRIHLTTTGCAQREPIHRAWEHLEADTTAGLSPGELAFLREVLGKVRANLAHPDDACDTGC
jgi:DNA-binding MarR family transcriptional regulator